MITVRRASEKDIRGIHAIETECSSMPWSMGQFTEELWQDYAFLLAAEEDGQLIGFADLHVVSDDAHINELGVRGDRRRRGAASALMEEIIRISRERGAEQISLEVRQSNAAAIALYEKHGFCVAGIRKGLYRDPREDGYTMVKRLETCLSSE